MIKVLDMNIPTLDDINVSGKKIIVRVDINSPVDKKTKKLLDYSRIQAHSVTIRELIDKKAGVVIISHQGRPGDDDFISLEEHAKVMSKYVGQEIEFVDDVIGPYSRERIRNLKPGEAIMLQNLRLISEETVEGPIEAQKDTFIVKTLAPLVDVYVNDAFATAHRSQPSLVGFPLVLPSAAGRVMEKEISALSKIFNEPDRPKVFVLGGGKVPDSLKIIENLVKKKVADKILTGGLLAEVLALAQGYQLSKENLKVIEDKGLLSQVQRAKELMPLIKDNVEIPVDFRTEEDGKVNDYPINDVHGVIKDIGERTIMKYSQEIQEAKVVVLRGPMGVIEDERFKQGSAKILKATLESKAFVIVGGGHMISVLGGMKTDPKKVHISTGGGALLLFLAGDKLPALVALSKTSTAVKV